MHGLKQISQINELAALNANCAPEAAIAAADERRKGVASQLDIAHREAVAQRDAERGVQLSALAILHPLDLVALVQTQQLSTNLEDALANKLAYVYEVLCEAVGAKAANSYVAQDAASDD